MFFIALIILTLIALTFAICACRLASIADDADQQIADQIANGGAAIPSLADWRRARIEGEFARKVGESFPVHGREI